MRGKYQITHNDRRKFFYELCDLCRKPTEPRDLVSTQLSMYDCINFLQELGYIQDEWITNGWEGDTCGYYSHTKHIEDKVVEDAPKIWVSADAYSGSLHIGFADAYDDNKEIDTEALKELMRKHWGKYFPVI